MYVVTVRIDETLPWIELKGEYQTKREAKRAAETLLGNIRVRIVTIPEKRTRMKVLATIR